MRCVWDPSRNGRGRTRPRELAWFVEIWASEVEEFFVEGKDGGDEAGGRVIAG